MSRVGTLSALAPIAAAAYAALNVAAYTALSTGGIFDDVPEGTKAPFTWLTVRESPFNTFGRGGKDAELQVHVFSAYAGMQQAQTILAKALALLQETTPAVTGFTTLLLEYLGAQPYPDEVIGGVRAKHLVGRFRWLVEEA
jgi:hypothetical protein